MFKYKDPPLKGQLNMVWIKLEMNVIQNHIDSILKKIKAVIKAADDITSYY